MSNCDFEPPSALTMLLSRHTRRREFIAGLGSASAWPVVARAQQSPVPVVGWLSAGSPDLFARLMGGFRQGLNETGYVDGRTLTIEPRWAGDQYDRLPAMAAELVRRQVAVIAGGGLAAAQAAKAATSTIPIVFQVGADPVGVGLVASLSRPGGNFTGVTTLGNELGPKRLELAQKVVPSATSMALLVNSTNPTPKTETERMQEAARILGLQLHVLRASTDREFDMIFANVVQLRAGALLITPDPLFVSRSEQLAALAIRYSVPAIFQYREFAAASGLMSYGSNSVEAYRLVGTYTGRILKGEKPADLPVQQAAKVELIINLKTAKALGLTIPETLLATADEVIQ